VALPPGVQAVRWGDAGGVPEDAAERYDTVVIHGRKRRELAATVHGRRS